MYIVASRVMQLKNLLELHPTGLYKEAIYREISAYRAMRAASRDAMLNRDIQQLRADGWIIPSVRGRNVDRRYRIVQN